MSTTLRDFIAQRETEIRDLQKALKAELRELQLAKAALEQGEVPTPSGGSLTIKDMAREVLSGLPNGLNSSGILEGIKKSFGRDIERTSLSPQLSRMKDDGELVLDGEMWFTKQNYEIKIEKAWTSGAKALAAHADQMPDQRPIHEQFDDDVPF